MTFDELLTQVCDLLQRQGRVSYRALKRRFSLDDDYLEDLKVEIIKAQRLAVDEDGEVLVWQPALTPASPQPERPPDTPAYETTQLRTTRGRSSGPRCRATPAHGAVL